MSSYIIADHVIVFFFFFNDTATTEIYTLSLHDALPISRAAALEVPDVERRIAAPQRVAPGVVREGLRVLLALYEGFSQRDRKSTRLNSSHSQISYAVFCLKKKKHTIQTR